MVQYISPTQGEFQGAIRLAPLEHHSGSSILGAVWHRGDLRLGVPLVEKAIYFGGAKQPLVELEMVQFENVHCYYLPYA